MANRKYYSDRRIYKFSNYEIYNMRECLVESLIVVSEGEACSGSSSWIVPLQSHSRFRVMSTFWALQVLWDEGKEYIQLVVP
jgi:hypothetical protein